MSEFKIGTTLGGMQALETIFSPGGSVFDPDWSYQPFAGAIRLADGTIKGQGFPVAKWRFNHISNDNRDALRSLIPGLSALLYIRTPTNEIDIYGDIVWGSFQAVAEWTPEDEDKAAAETLGFVLTFTHLIEQV
jgi:hypothetical protein